MLNLSSGSDEWNDLVRELAAIPGMSITTASEQLKRWITAGIDAKEQRVQIAIRCKETRMVPIWRCAVCGRADLPYVACWVAPYVVRYDPVLE